jgi:hypothetical protein
VRSTIHRYEIEPYGSPISLKAVCNRTRLISEAWILPFLDFDLYASLRRRRQSCSTQSLSNLGSYVSNYSKSLVSHESKDRMLRFHSILSWNEENVFSA